MRKLFILSVVGLWLALALTACGGDAAEAPAVGASVGDAVAGETLYKQPVIGTASAPGCATCHSLEPNVVVVGPSHAGVATRAGNYLAGVSAENYLRESILNPNAHVVEGFQPGIMYQTYGQELSETEINNLVAFLLTLK